MRFLLLPFFIVLLLLKTLPFLLILITTKLLPHRALIISFLILSMAVIILLTPSLPSAKNQNNITETNLIKQKNKLENLLSQQPTHRDILLNLAKINQVLENEPQAIDLENKARDVDPNNIIFQGN